ncbi:ESX secretion-associated protein EspG [Nocardia brasiliensis]|uniref:ESX secretion-associated protein EspG n=1 Tax=Nocardia brasiliensis TaxID=37326 RepID=UPI00366DE6EC
MTATWSFTDLEFKVLWERHTDAPLPEPFVYKCRIEYDSDYERAKYQTWERLRATMDRSFDGVLDTVARPDVVVTAFGWCDDDMENPAKRLWVHAARAGAQAYVLKQLPGETIQHSGGFTVTECEPRDLATAVVATLPAVAAGRLPSVAIVTEEAKPEERFGLGRPLIADDGEETAGARSLRFLSAQATTTGVISIRQGYSKFGPRGVLEQLLLWRDLTDDGRYVIPLDGAPVAVGIGAKRLARLVDDSIDVVVDRLETHWETGDALPQGGFRHAGAAW